MNRVIIQRHQESHLQDRLSLLTDESKYMLSMYITDRYLNTSEFMSDLLTYIYGFKNQYGVNEDKYTYINNVAGIFIGTRPNQVVIDNTILTTEPDEVCRDISSLVISIINEYSGDIGQIRTDSTVSSLELGETLISILRYVVESIVTATNKAIVPAVVTYDEDLFIITEGNHHV